MVPWGVAGVQKPWLKSSPQPAQAFAGLQTRTFGGGYGGGQFQQGGRFPYQGGGGGFQQNRGGYGGQQGRAPAPVPSSFNVDPTMRFFGTVTFYHKWKGYGFIQVSQPGVVPSDRLFVHWRNIQSDDRFPFLVKDVEVEFSITKHNDFKKWNNMTVLRAVNVTLVGGTSVSLQDDQDAQQKNFVGGQHLRYTGSLKFYTPRLGFGYVTMDQGYDVDPSVPVEIRVETAEVNAGGRQPVWMENVAVEFGIWKTQRGGFKVYNMTLPGGHPLTQDALENRISMGVQSWQGEVMMWNWRQGWGFIKPSPFTPLPTRVVARLQQQVTAARTRGKNISEDQLLYFRRADILPGIQPQKGSLVSYQLYIDDKGAGACDVQG